MTTKAILICGGRGDRMKPITNVIAKHLLPVFDLPLFYYQLALLKESGITDVLIVAASDGLSDTRRQILTDKLDKVGLTLTLKIQPQPRGIPDAVRVATTSAFLTADERAVVLYSDMLHISHSLPKLLDEARQQPGGHLFCLASRSSTNDLVELDDSGAFVAIHTDPAELDTHHHDFAGLAVIDSSGFASINRLRPSARGILEVADWIMASYTPRTLTVHVLPEETICKDIDQPVDLLIASDAVYKFRKEHPDFGKLR